MNAEFVWLVSIERLFMARGAVLAEAVGYHVHGLGVARPLALDGYAGGIKDGVAMHAMEMRMDMQGGVETRRPVIRAQFFDQAGFYQ